jgi:hypothetical protein
LDKEPMCSLTLKVAERGVGVKSNYAMLYEPPVMVVSTRVRKY